MRRFLAIILCVSLLAIPVRAEAPTKYVALTFDDGPSGRFTRRLLDGLKERDVKATFLLCGYRIKDYGPEARRIAEEGHEIGIHGYSHDSMCAMSQSQATKEILDTAALLPQGVRPVFLRPPGGQCGDGMCQAAKSQGLAVLNWSLDSKDWAIKDARAITERVVGNVQDGDVILMHDMYDSSVDAALAIIDALTEQGYRFVTATELVRLRGAKLQAGEVYCSFP
ncbi:MAG: polysaccharide deacetylase family protein [Oscillospiraceae bacterium]|nr:polysaccharide deacetylase family protein [Oscillospiraceae bacterium]MBQ7802237.1 polysaccharide deacetylase family protein [Oscillospiraceae bacterium]